MGRATEVLSESVPALVERGEGLLAQGDVASAASTLRRVLAQSPTHIGAMEALAKAYWRLSDFESLLPLIERMVALNPYEPGYHALRGGALQGLGRYGDAVRSFERSSDPSSQAAIDELHAWQYQLIAALLSSDSEFQLAYARDPQAACESRGFSFAGTENRPRVRIPELIERDRSFDRPS